MLFRSGKNAEPIRRLKPEGSRPRMWGLCSNMCDGVEPIRNRRSGVTLRRVGRPVASAQLAAASTPAAAIHLSEHTAIGEMREQARGGGSDAKMP